MIEKNILKALPSQAREVLEFAQQEGLIEINKKNGKQNT